MEVPVRERKGSTELEFATKDRTANTSKIKVHTSKRRRQWAVKLLNPLVSLSEEYSHFQPLLVRNSRKSECGFKLGRIRGVEGGLVALRGLWYRFLWLFQKPQYLLQWAKPESQFCLKLLPSARKRSTTVCGYGWKDGNRLASLPLKIALLVGVEATYIWGRCLEDSLCCVLDRG